VLASWVRARLVAAERSSLAAGRPGAEEAPRA
jgi:hypothetical protein